MNAFYLENELKSAVKGLKLVPFDCNAPLYEYMSIGTVSTIPSFDCPAFVC